MKNFFFLLLLCPFLILAQDDVANQDSYENFKQWHLDLGVGFANNARAHDGAPGFPVTDANGNPIISNTVNPFSGIQLSAGLRYMFTDGFGLRFRGAYNSFADDPDNSTFSYNSAYVQTSLEGVLNAGGALNFQNWTDRFGLQLYGGIGAGFHLPDSDWSTENTEQTWNLVAGVTPLYRLNKNLTLTMNIQFMTVHGMAENWSGRTSVTTRSIDGIVYNAGFGLNIALGRDKSEGSIDWYYDNPGKEVDAMKNKLAQLEEDLNNKEDKKADDDNDGVPNVISNYVQNYHTNNMPSNVVTNFGEALVQDGYIRIFFGFDESMPNESSISDISSLIHFLENNEDANVELIGMTDVLGPDSYNDALSQRRAKNVHDILVEAGIDASRLESRGNGKNPVYTSKNDYIRMLARTVTVKLK
jgi:OOP family OmpA-OmpF porin